MQKLKKYPRIIPDKPNGDDCFDGHSQERLANSISDYIRRIDGDIYNQTSMCNKDEYPNDSSLPPRIIGLEGKWGSGKSNVVYMIKQQLDAESYYTFTYDSWAHQEDLQRRSILESMTNDLIKKKVLSGKVDIRMRNGKPKNDTWENQLSLLLSNKTTTIRKTTPQLTESAICGMIIAIIYFIWSLFSEHLIFCSEDYSKYGWIDFVFIIFVAGIVIPFWVDSIRFKHKSFLDLFRIIDYTNNDTIEEEFTSSEEPSVIEFKNWMQSISEYLENRNNKYNRLIIVFDNMDRLPSSKVMQLWSTIYTFFSEGGYNRIWTIIPYDYKHLCQTIYGEDSDLSYLEKKERIKHFISKTFPITYHIPYPVITDYKKLFFTYFDKAFGPNVHDREHICRVFMLLNEQPNPRNVIYFINELVLMRLQWEDKSYRLQNQALYILKKDFLFYEENDNLAKRLLDDKLFDKVAPFYPDKERVLEELCQYAYGLEDKKLAGELPLIKVLVDKIKIGAPISEYAERYNFISVLEHVISNIDMVSLDSAVKSLASLDTIELDENTKIIVKKQWDFFANIKKDYGCNKHCCDDTVISIIHHASDTRIVDMARSCVKSLQNIEVTDGASYFRAFNKIREELESSKIKFDDSRWYKRVYCEPEHFVNYVYEAKSRYTSFKLYTDPNILNKYLLSEITTGNYKISEFINYVVNDNDYDFSSLKKKLSECIKKAEIRQNICVGAYVHRKLTNDKVKDIFPSSVVSEYLKNEKSNWRENPPLGIEDVISMSLAYKVDVENLPDELLPRVSECLEFYLDYSELLKHVGRVSDAFFKLNVYYIKNIKGLTIDPFYVAMHLTDFHNRFKIDYSDLFSQFNRWTIDWNCDNNENEYFVNYRSYVLHPLFSEYLNNPGNFSSSIIKLAIRVLNDQEKGFLVQYFHQTYPYSNSYRPPLTTDSYWKSFVEIFLGSIFMKKSGERLTIEATIILDYLYKYNTLKEQSLLDNILRNPDETVLKKYMDIMFQFFIKEDITVLKFQYFGSLLPILGSDMDTYKARSLISHFISPVCLDKECAKIIVTYKDFYLAVIRFDPKFVSNRIKQMLAMEEYSSIKDELIDLIAD